MGAVFIVRGTQTDAWYSSSGKTTRTLKTSAGTADVFSTAKAGASIFGGSVIDMNLAAAVRACCWTGNTNAFNTTAFAVIVRIVPKWTGVTPTGTLRQALFAIMGATGFDFLEFNLETNGRLSLSVSNALGSGVVGVTTVTAFSAVAGVASDLMVSWDGSNTAGSVKFSVEGTEIGALNPTAAMVSFIAGLTGVISVGYSTNAFRSDYDLNELVLLDNAQNHIYTPRTDFWPVAAFDGQLNTDPGQVNVRNLTGYAIAGVPKVGSAIVSAAATTAIGTQADDGVGTYAALERYTDFGVNNIRFGVSGKFNSITNNRTGTTVAAVQATTKINVAADGGVLGTYVASERWTALTAGQIKHGVAFQSNSVTPNVTGDYVGADLWEAVAAADLRAGVTKLQAGTPVDGLINLPTEPQVEKNITYDNATKTGTLIKALVATTKIGEPANDGTGTYDAVERYTDFSNANIRESIAGKFNSETDNRLGTLVPITILLEAGASLAGPNAEADGVGQIITTVGDTTDWEFTAPGIDLTGAVLTPRVRKQNGGQILMDSSQVTIDPDQVANKGKFRVSPTKEQALALEVGEKQLMLVDGVQGSKELTLRGNVITVKSDSLS